MSVMLGNRYFIARQFDKALDQYEQAFEHSNFTIKIKKRVIICYIQTNQIDQAIRYFYNLVIKDPAIIIDTDPYLDDCPCPEVIPDWENIKRDNPQTANINEILGMLYLYCDLDKAIKAFEESIALNRQNILVSSIIKKLKAYRRGKISTSEK